MAKSANTNPRPEDSDPLAQLIRAAGRRAPIAPGREVRVRQAVRATWAGVVSRRRAKFRLITWGLKLAAAVVLLAVGAHYYTVFTKPTSVAKIELLSGSLALAQSDGNQKLSLGDDIFSGGVIETDGNSRAALRLAQGPSLRLDTATRIHLDKGGRVIRLDSGAIYVDSANADSKSSLTISTDYGEVHDIGTQFETRVIPTQARPLCIRVREGKIDLKREGGASMTALAGTEVTAPANGPVVQRKISSTDPAWGWVAEMAPAFHMEGVTLDVFLVWVCREQGWKLVYDDAGIGAAAKSIVLHGALDGMPPGVALDAVMRACGLPQPSVTTDADGAALHVTHK